MQRNLLLVSPVGNTLICGVLFLIKLKKTCQLCTFFQVFKIIKVRTVGSDLENSSWKTLWPFFSFSPWAMPLFINVFTFEKVVFCLKY